MKRRTRRVATRVGAGVLTAAALAVAGAYLLSSKDQRRKAKAWVVKARREVARNVKNARRLSEVEYKRIVDRATKRYGSLHNVNAEEAVKIAREMKAEWQRFRKNAKVLAAMARGRKSSAPGGVTRKTRRPAGRK